LNIHHKPRGRSLRLSASPIAMKRRGTQKLPAPGDPIIEAERATLLSRLVGGTTHELNNPLSVLMGQVALLRRAVSADPVLSARADRISEATDRCARIVRSFVALSDPPGHPGTVDLDRVVRDTLELLAHGLRSRGIEVRFEPGAPVPAWADSRSLRELLAHLVLSFEPALEASPPPRFVAVKTGIGPTPQTLELKITLSAGLGAQIAKKGARESVSLGVSRFLAATVGGSLEVEGSGGRECTIQVVLPASGPLPVSPSPSRGSRRVLLVSGHEEFAEFVTEVLASGGHVAARAEAGENPDAVRAKGFDLVILEADLGGLDLLGWISKDRDHLLILAGDALPTHIARLVDEAGVKVLRKPIVPEELLDAIARANP
jgi:CheY-like chemotaxis protein